MSSQAVKEYFQKIGRPDLTIQEFAVSSATVELAAAAVGAPPAQIAKTLAIRVKEQPILLVAGGQSRLDNRKFKAYFHGKAKMLSAEETLALTGHPVGGVCPFGLATPLPVYLDESLRAFSYVYPAAGAANNAVKVATEELSLLTGGVWVDVCTAAGS